MEEIYYRHKVINSNGQLENYFFYLSYRQIMFKMFFRLNLLAFESSK